MLRALVARDEAVVAVDDAPAEAGRALARDLGVELVEAPDRDRLRALVETSAAVLPSPGVPDHHPLFELAAAAGVPVLSELDLAARWDDRPLLAVTGTNGKTTVTTLTSRMLSASGLRAAAVGNTEVPLVAAIEDADLDVFVVEASSFRLLHSHHFAPDVGTWLNFAPDHLDNHATLAEYEAAKARIWRDQRADQVAIGNADDPVVAVRLASAPGRKVTFGLGSDADHRLDGDRLVCAGEELARRDELPRRLPHDVINALAAAATALAGGATMAGARAALLAFEGLPHRVVLVGEAGGVDWYDDSKATAPHATLAALRGFGSVVLIAGGRNKGLDLNELLEEVDRIRAVVAIGEAAGEVEAVFAGRRPVRTAGSMDAAVAAAAELAATGDVVLLSPACASFDWYGSYGERGDDFVRAVRGLGVRP